MRLFLLLCVLVAYCPRVSDIIVVALAYIEIWSKIHLSHCDWMQEDWLSLISMVGTGRSKCAIVGFGTAGSVQCSVLEWAHTQHGHLFDQQSSGDMTGCCDYKFISPSWWMKILLTINLQSKEENKRTIYYVFIRTGNVPISVSFFLSLLRACRVNGTLDKIAQLRQVPLVHSYLVTLSGCLDDIPIV